MSGNLENQWGHVQIERCLGTLGLLVAGLPDQACHFLMHTCWNSIKVLGMNASDVMERVRFFFKQKTLPALLMSSPL